MVGNYCICYKGLCLSLAKNVEQTDGQFWDSNSTSYSQIENKTGNELKNIFRIFTIFIPNSPEIWYFNISLQIWSNAVAQWPLDNLKASGRPLK